MAKNLQEYVKKNFAHPEIFSKKGNLYRRLYDENDMQHRFDRLIENGTIKYTEPTEPEA